MAETSGGDKLLRHSFFMMAVANISFIANTLYHVAMGWLLPPAEYGVLASMSGAVLLMLIPMDAMRSAMGHFSARLVVEGKAAEVRALAAFWARRLAFVSIPLTLILLLFSGPIAGFFQMSSRAPVAVTALVMGAVMFVPILIGAHQGLQSFSWMASVMHGWSVVRLLAGASLVLVVGRSAVFGLSGHLLGVLTSASLGIVGLRVLLKSADGDVAPVRGVNLYLFRSLLVLGAYALLMNADTLIIKRFFDPETAGLYVRAPSIARLVIFVVIPIGLVLFPKVASTGGTSEGDWRTFGKAIGLSLVVVLSAVAACCLFPRIPLFLVYGDREPAVEMVQLVRAFACAMAPLAMGYLMINFELAQHRFKALNIIILCAVAYIAGVVIWHESIWQIVTILGVCNLVGMISLIFGLPWKRARG
ncbi:MAG: hypothetical protein KJ626_15560 [Verrucomicrobia bacterium]|nr:hypothetical protein [Verrucomicrobiota bacterium]